MAQVKVFQDVFMQVQDIKRKDLNGQDVFPNEGEYFVFYLREFFGTVWYESAIISDDKVRLAEIWSGHY